VVVKGGERKERHPLRKGTVVLGRTEGDVQFPDDRCLAPSHARVLWKRERLWIEDLSGSNGVFLRTEEPTLLRSGDLLCLGGLFLRYDEDTALAQGTALRQDAGVRPHGSGRERARGHLVRILQDGSDGPSYPLVPSKTIFGRKAGHFLFPDDPLMSRQHAQFYERDGDMAVEDLGSSNGTMVRIRASAPLDGGTVFRIGDQTLEVIEP
jgi:pSer/pThr/pTyr-binding forkhead associated (FHA) protein